MVASSNSNRSYAAAHFALELDDGQPGGLFKSIEGGSMRADVMTYVAGNMQDHWRQIGKPKFEDIKIQVGMAMSPRFYTWIAQFFTGNTVRHSGAIIAADFYYNERARRSFSYAMIKELTFPKLDANDKNAVYMTVGMAVEDIQFRVGSGEQIAQPKGMEGQKLWTANNFRFRLHGLDDFCRRTSKIDSFTIKQDVAEYHMGGLRAPTKFPGRIDYPNFTFYVPEADAGPFYAHAEAGIRSGQVNRMTAGLDILDNAQSVLCTVNIGNCDIIGVTPDRSDATTEEIKMVKVELYTEAMSLSYASLNVVNNGGSAVNA